MTRKQMRERIATLNRYSTKDRLTAEQERELIGRAKRGDLRARREVGRVHLRFVLGFVAKLRVPETASLEDLIHEGTIGLMHALDKFEPARGWRFSTYAVHWIRAAVLRYLREQGTSVVSPKAETTAPMDLSMNLPHDPNDPNSDQWIAFLPDESQGEHVFHSAVLAGAVRRAVGRLDSSIDREVVAVRLSRGSDGDTLEDIGRRHGVSREWVRKREVMVRAKLKIRLAKFEDAA